MKVSTNTFEWCLKGLIISLKILLQKREYLDSKISFLVRNQGNYQTKEMIKPLRRHSKVYVETFMMKKSRFLNETDILLYVVWIYWFSWSSIISWLFQPVFYSAKWATKLFFCCKQPLCYVNKHVTCQLHYVKLRYVMSTLTICYITLRYVSSVNPP